MKKALITGITGQDGAYLSRLLLAKGYQVHGIVRRVALEDPDHRLWRLKPILNKIKLHAGSLESYASLFNIVQKIKPDECYHLAAQSFVSYSFEDEFSTINTNINGTLFMLSAIKHRAPKCKFYFAGCYSDDTKILTRDGIKKYNEVTSGDKIYTVNVKTNQIELKPIKKVIVKKYKGKMVHIKGKRIDLLVTPDHNMLLKRGGKLFYEKAQNIKEMAYDGNSDIGFPTPVWKGISREYIDFADFVDISGLPCNTNKNLIKRMKSSDYLYLLGVYIGDGYTGKYKYSRTMPARDFIKIRNNKGHFVHSQAEHETLIYPSNYIFFAIPEKDKARKKVINILKKYKIEFRAKSTTIEFSSATLQKMFKQSGNNKYEKHIPEWALELSPKLLHYLYDGLIDSDGNRRKDGRDCFTTTSKRLMEGFAELCVKLQFTSKVFYKKAGKVYFRKEKRFFNSRKHYSISVNHGFEKKIYKKHIKEKKYNGIVWCLEMEGNHNFIIERKGDFYFCGNSSEMFGQVREVPQTETTPFHPRSPYGISKVAGFELTRNYREAYGLFACNGILFNHESPMRGYEFVTRKITLGVARIKAGLAKEIKLGNLEAKRDWGFAGDFVEAMYLMLQEKKPDDYVVATGETHTVRRFVELAFGYAGLDWKKYVKQDKELFRPAEVNLLIGDPSKAKRVLGWKQKVGFEELVKMMMDEDLRRVKCQKQF